MQIAFGILALLVVGAILGSTLNFAGVFLGIPLVFLFLGAVVGKEQLERQRRIMQMKRFRRDAQARKLPPTEEDKRTLVT
jgi:Sec-independent protein secretion pathway component TatC